MSTKAPTYSRCGRQATTGGYVGGRPLVNFEARRDSKVNLVLRHAVSKVQPDASVLRGKPLVVAEQCSCGLR